MNMDDRFLIAEQVVARPLGNEIVILNLESGTYFGLNEIGALIWNAVEKGRSVSEMCAIIHLNYDAILGEVEIDVTDLLHKMHGQGLIRPSVED